MASDLAWGSKAWREHMRRSLAQRKRHGEHIKDIDGLIDYIEKRGPAKSKKKKAGTKPGRKVSDSQKSKTTKPAPAVGAYQTEILFSSPKILRVR